MAALFLGRRKDIKKAASGPITEQVSGEQHNCCSVIGNLQNLKKLQNIFYDGTMCIDSTGKVLCLTTVRKKSQ